MWLLRLSKKEGLEEENQVSSVHLRKSILKQVFMSLTYIIQ
jgi:hypothetical protein